MVDMLEYIYITRAVSTENCLYYRSSSQFFRKRKFNNVQSEPTVNTAPAVYLCSEEGRDVVQAVAVVVGGNQLQDGELPSLRYGQVNTQTETGGGGEGQPQTVTLTGQTLHSFTGWHVLQHVRLQQAGLLLRGTHNKYSFYNAVLLINIKYD